MRTGINQNLYGTYTEVSFFMFSLRTRLNAMFQIEVLPFDMLQTLQAQGEAGWEVAGICLSPISQQGAMQTRPTPGAELPPQQLLCSLVRRSNRVVQYTMAEVSLRLIAGMAGMKMDGSLTPTIQAYAAAGWGLVGVVNMPMKMKGLTMTAVFRLFFSDVVGGYDNRSG